MCLGIPGQVVEITDPDAYLAKVDVNGIKRSISVRLLADSGIDIGDWVLVHVGFAMAKIDEREATATLDAVRRMGKAYTDELDDFRSTGVGLADHAKGTVRSDKWPLNYQDPPLKGEEMKFADEFRDPAAARALVKSITELAGDGEYKFMEVCGGHTHTIYRHGLEHLLPSSIELVHGPGCPVCVIPMGRVDDAIWLASRPDVIFTTFGDMMRVPGSDGSLLEARARGCDVRFVYSPLDALKIAVDNPAKQVVYFAVGFETTAPSTAVTLTRARQLGVANFSVFCNHVTIVPAIKAILDSPDLRLSGFIGPGHVSTVIGNRPYRFVPEVYGKPIVVAGFEPLDILQSVYMLLAQLREGRCEVENQYSRVVRDEGNPAALALLAEVFELRAHFEWRGLGFISQSALKLSAAYAEFDAELRYSMPGLRVADPKACQCGEVLKGVIKPWECKVFGTACTPETPIGTCMVSPEGACAAYYNFGRLHRETAALVGQQRAAAHG